MSHLDSLLSRSAGVQPMRQIPLDLGPAIVHSLDDFVEGANADLLGWLRAWPAVSGPVSPAYLWGPSGSGKTHLMRAMVEHALGKGLGVVWLNAQTCQMWDAADPLSPTLALIDECEQLDADHQHLAFNLFIESASPSSPTETGPLFIMAAGNVPPVDLPVRDDLRTRLGWGLIFALHPLDEAGVRDALQREATRRGMALGEGVLSYLLTRHSRDLGFLMNLLDRLDRYALAEHRLITVPLLKQMLAVETP
ncbi:MAG: HdaA/DnaA family protein [Aquabacterium sp.]|uniref:HdaA/DnaA family protein n=1 Tax=Aquabacterium sp. TaxID=1872578 RepID=UPI0025DBDDAE|nr:DnaA regulatory inactivator Hda [uncultured Aquabacterium sp.]